MSYIKVTNSFYFFEFAPKGAKKTWLPTNDIMGWMVKVLAHNLQILRNNLPTASYISIVSGVRSSEDTMRLIQNGYHPSPTSDHNYGYPVALDPNTKKYRNFGPLYSYSVGAADCQCGGNFTTMQMFKKAVELTKKGITSFGQVIYEENPSTGSKWVHFGNDAQMFLSEWLSDFIGRKKFLQSLDGGKTYKEYR